MDHFLTPTTTTASMEINCEIPNFAIIISMIPSTTASIISPNYDANKIPLPNTEIRVDLQHQYQNFFQHEETSNVCIPGFIFIPILGYFLLFASEAPRFSSFGCGVESGATLGVSSVFSNIT